MSTPYNEDTIVQLIRELYEVLIKLCVIDETQIIHPPEGGHAINTELCNSLNIDPAVTALMKRLPYPKDRDTRMMFELFSGGYPFAYIYDEELRNGRDPERCPTDGIEPLRLDFLLPHELAFTFPSSPDGYAVFLDTRENTIRVFDAMNFPPGKEPVGDNYQPERPGNPEHYRNFVPHNAPTYIRAFIDKINRLDIIPCGVYSKTGFWEQERDPEVHERMKAIVESYGWPDNFRREEYQQNMERHWLDEDDTE